MTMLSLRSLSAALAGATLAGSSATASGPTYEITRLGPATPTPGAWSESSDINVHGQAAGLGSRSNSQVFPTLWLPSADLGLPAGANDLGDYGVGAGRAYGINDLGQCVGFITPLTGGYDGFLWDPIAGVIDLGSLGGEDTIARSINNAGLIVGDSFPADASELWHAFLHDGEGMTDLGTLGGNRSWGQDINELGQVVGESYVDHPDHPDNPTVRAYLWLPEPAYGLPAGMNNIDDFSTEHGQISWARGINDRGQISGSVYWTNEVGQGVTQLAIWLPEPDLGLPAGWNDLRGLNGIRGTAFPKSINNKGVLTSRAVLDPNDPFSAWSAAIWVQGQWFDLNECLAPLDGLDWQLSSAEQINDRGQIVGWGVHLGEYVGFLLTPTFDTAAPACSGDVTRDGVVDVNDLLVVISNWGNCPIGCVGGCAGDVVTDCNIDVNDLLELLGQWGPCLDVPPMGGCCFPITGDCEEMIEAECVFYGGTWSPGDCSTVVCEQPATGACCFYPSGTCAELNEFQCFVQDGTWLGAGSSCDTAECPVPPQGDTIEDPFIIDALPFSDAGNTTGFGHWYDEVCDDWTSHSPDVVYAFTPSRDDVINISTCDDSAYDTKLFVYEDVEGNVVGCNEDACSTPAFPAPYVAHIEALTVFAGHTYYIIVDGWQGDRGIYTLDIESIVPGACCLPDGTCSESSEAWCTDHDGTWFIDATCDDVTCPDLPTGACCIGTGLCIANQTEWDCEVVQGGTWQGEGTSCFGADCP